MLIHLTPRLYSPFRDVRLASLTIPEFGIHLRGEHELATRRPYPNKHYAVACRRRGARAMNGLLFDVASTPATFTAIALWQRANGFTATHRVEYQIRDSDHDAASEYMITWYGSAGGFPSRWPADIAAAPVDVQPRMELHQPGKVHGVVHELTDDATGLLIERHERFSMPTIERARLEASPWMRIP